VAPDGEKVWDMITRFDTIGDREGQQDRRTDTARRHRPRLCIASLGKNPDFHRFVRYCLKLVRLGPKKRPQQKWLKHGWLRMQNSRVAVHMLYPKCFVSRYTFHVISNEV